MKLTILGCSGSMSGPNSAASAYLLQTTDAQRTWSMVFDFGPGAMGSLLRHIDPRQVDAMVISHAHADHMADMVGMQVYRRWHPAGALGPVKVLGPSNMLSRVQGVGGDDPSETYTGEFEFITHKENHEVQVGPFTITAFAVRHPVEAYALRVSDGHKVFAFSGDSDTCEGLTRAATQADLFLCEAAFETGRDTVRGVHLDGERAGKVAAEAGVDSLVLTHIQPWTDPKRTLGDAQKHYGGPISLATMNAVYEF